MFVFKIIIKGFIFPFFLSIISILSILLLGKMVPLVEFFVRSGASFYDLVKTFLLFMPVVMQFAIPISALFAMLIAFIRLTKDGEVIGLMAIGLRPERILYPVLLISGVIFFASLFISLHVLPLSKREAREFLKEVGQKSLSKGIVEGRFVELSRGLIFFTNKNRHNGKRLKGIFLWDARDEHSPLTVYAQKGSISSLGSDGLVLQLKNGVITQKDSASNKETLLLFKQYLLSIGVNNDNLRLTRGEMTIKGLKNMMRQPQLSPSKKRRYLSEMIRRFCLPFGAFLLCLSGAVIGIFFGKRGISQGIALGIIVFMAYYLLNTLCKNIFEAGNFPSSSILYIPNILFILINFWLWRLLFKKGPQEGVF